MSAVRLTHVVLAQMLLACRKGDSSSSPTSNVYYLQEGHGWEGAELEDPKAKTLEFLDAHLR